MDLITTGVSASERSRRANLVVALRELIAEKLSPGSSPGLKMNQVIDFPQMFRPDLLMYELCHDYHSWYVVFLTLWNGCLCYINLVRSALLI